MSYLEASRLAFHGRFVSDVSTRNNLTSNYEQRNPIDLWNRLGGGTFDLVDCKVSGVGTGDADPAIGWSVGGAFDRPSAKMVDLDPDWQMASEIWGLELGVRTPEGELAFTGKLRVCAFRDLFPRLLNAPNGQPLGARYVSSLEEVEWGPALAESPVLQELQNSTEGGRLSVCLHVFSYWYAKDAGGYTTGRVVGNIGPWKEGQPRTALVARRIQPVRLQTANPNRPFLLLHAIDFEIRDNTLVADLGHALRLADLEGTPAPLGSMVSQITGAPVLGFEGAAGFEPLAPLQIGDLDWYRSTGGVVRVELSPAQAARAHTETLALAVETNGGPVVVTRETRDGVFARADDFVFRLDTEASGDPVKAKAEVYVRRLGQPLAGVDVYVDDPSAANGASAAGLGFASREARTDPNGVARFTLLGTDPGNPRGVIDGQVLAAPYGTRRDANGSVDRRESGLENLDVIVAHVRDAYSIPDEPEFYRDVRPLLAQYAFLYPVMSAHLFDLTDYDALTKRRHLLLHVFGRDIQDPNYMPVTRDLSKNRLQMLVRWLQGTPPLREDTQPQDLAVTVASERDALRNTYAGEGRDLRRVLASLTSELPADLVPAGEDG